MELDKPTEVKKTGQDVVQKDFDVWFPDRKFKMTSGEVIELPKLSWGRESKAIRIMLSIVNQTPELKSMVGGLDGAQIFAILPQWLEKFSDKVSEILSHLVDKDSKWIDDNFTMEDVLNILGPFFKRLSSKVKQVMETVPMLGSVLQSPALSTSLPENTAGQSTKS